jgi:hypothetical protein
MSGGNNHKIWLTGERFNVDYLFDTATGEVLQKLVSRGLDATTAGTGRYCCRRFVAVYVAPDHSGVVLQVDGARFPLDGRTKVEHRRRFGGTLSSLSVSRPGQEDVSVNQLTVGILISRLIDPAYDELDESLDDYLADIADIIRSDERQQSILAHKEPDAGPWEYEERRRR